MTPTGSNEPTATSRVSAERDAGDSPIIIDDGGSTRIKQINTASTMDGLLGRNHADAPANTFKKAVVVSLDADGDEKKRKSQALQVGDAVKVESANGQVATLTILGGLRGDLALSGGVEPIVEAKQTGDQRRYVVTNAGAIQKITHTTNAGVATVLFNLADFTAANIDIVYTMLTFRIKP